MNKKMHKIVIFCILAGLLTGCSSAFITAAQVTQPVMLGKIKRIQVNDPESEQRQQKVPFDIRIKIPSLPPRYQDFTRLADAELLKRIDSPQDEVIVDEIRIGSASFVFILLNTGNVGDLSEAGILGGIYSSQKDDHEKK
jgi:hypothetical protein